MPNIDTIFAWKLFREWNKGRQGGISIQIPSGALFAPMVLTACSDNSFTLYSNSFSHKSNLRLFKPNRKTVLKENLVGNCFHCYLKPKRMA